MNIPCLIYGIDETKNSTSDKVLQRPLKTYFLEYLRNFVNLV